MVGIYNSAVRVPGYLDKIYLDYIHLDFIYLDKISQTSPNMIFVAKKIMLAENHVLQVLYRNISIA